MKKYYVMTVFALAAAFTFNMGEAHAAAAGNCVAYIHDEFYPIPGGGPSNTDCDVILETVNGNRLIYSFFGISDNQCYDNSRRLAAEANANNCYGQ